MQYEATTPDEYMGLIEPDWRREKLEEIRGLVKRLGPELEEGIEYKMLCYSGKGKSIFHLNAQKSYVSLYVGNIGKVENSKNLLRAFDTGKGCIRIKKNINLRDTGIEEFVRQAIQIWRNNGNTDC